MMMKLPRSAAGVRAAILMWRRGVWEALQLQRCVVFFVLDNSGRVLAQTTRCIITNGAVYLGSLVLFSHATKPATDWLLQTYAEPAFGAGGVAVWQQLLAGVHLLLWLLPVYLVSLFVSCIWYQQIAVAAFEVQQQKQQQQQQQQHGAGELMTSTAAAAAGTSQHSPASLAADSGSGPASTPLQQQQQQPDWLNMHVAAQQQPAGVGGMMQVLEGTAQEVFRLLLFVVFTTEVFFISRVPGIGTCLNVLFLSWLYAYYCFDYTWALRGVRLPARLQFFESNWAYFAGFGFPCVAATVFWPFHAGAALANMLFPVFVIVACGADPLQARADVLGAAVAACEPAPAGRLPIFKLALRPTYWLVWRVFGGSGGGGGGGGGVGGSRSKQA